MRVKKGSFGYLHSQTRWEIGKTILFFAISFSLLAAGIITTGSKKNLLTVAAVLGMLPSSKSAISMFMFIKSIGCSMAAYEKVKGIAEDIENPVKTVFDTYMTSYSMNYPISCISIRNHCVCGLTESNSCDSQKAEEHISSMLKENGFHDMTVKVFNSLDKYVERMKEMQALEIGKEEEDVLELMLQLSL